MAKPNLLLTEMHLYIVVAIQLVQFSLFSKLSRHLKTQLKFVLGVGVLNGFDFF